MSLSSGDALQKIDFILRENIDNIGRLNQNVGTLWKGDIAKVRYIGRDLDGIALGNNLTINSKQFNLMMMRQAKPSRELALVATARNEGPYLVEWIAHNLIVGFEHIFIYTNSNTDGSLDLLKELQNFGLVTLIENDVADNISPQIKAYEHSIHLLRELRQYEWVAYFDVDEFIVPDERFDFSLRKMMNAALGRARHLNPQAILVNWDWYGSGGEIEYKEEMVQKRFNIRKDYATVKSICHLPSISHMDDVHIADHDLQYITAAGEWTSSVCYATPVPNYDGARLNHYFHKSLHEYGVKKQRGSGLPLLDKDARTFDHFFQWEPIRNINATELGTPPKLIIRVEQKMNEIRAMGDVARLERYCISEHKRISEAIFRDGGDDLVSHLRRQAEQG